MDKISVIVPAYNARKTILRCVESIKRQIYPRFEIIVVDDGSTDNTLRILRGIKGIKIISQKNKGPGSARNAGAKKARGKVLIFIDSDCEVLDRRWLKDIANIYKKKKEVAGIAAGYRGSIGKRFIEEYSYLELKYRLRNMPEYVSTASASNISCRKIFFDKIGGFNEEKGVIFAEDILFSRKLSQQGKLLWNSKSGVYHNFRDSLKDYLKQQAAYATSDVLLFAKYPCLFFGVTHHSNSVYFQIALTLMFIFSLVLSFFLPAFFILLLFVFLLIMLFNVKFLLFLKKEKGYKFMFNAFYVICIRNLAYVFGIMRGIKCAVFAGSRA